MTRPRIKRNKTGFIKLAKHIETKILPISKLALNSIIKISVLIGAILFIFTESSGVYYKTIGQKQYYYNKLGQLNAGAQSSYFNSVLGLPKYIQQQGKLKAYTYVFNYFYVNALVDKRGIVSVFSVTSREKDFQPSFKVWDDNINKFSTITLNKSTFVDADKLGMGSLMGVRAVEGVHHYYYDEIFWGANPGNYQFRIIGKNEAGYGGIDSIKPEIFKLIDTFGNYGGNIDYGAYKNFSSYKYDKNWQTENNKASAFVSSDKTKDIRNTTINTYTITDPYYSFDNYSGEFGPNYNEIRVDVSNF